MHVHPQMQQSHQQNGPRPQPLAPIANLISQQMPESLDTAMPCHAGSQPSLKVHDAQNTHQALTAYHATSSTISEPSTAPGPGGAAGSKGSRPSRTAAGLFTTLCEYSQGYAETFQVVLHQKGAASTLLGIAVFLLLGLLLVA